MRLSFHLALLLLSFTPLVYGQTGSIDPTEEQLTGLRVMETPEIELVEEKVVDLRRWMPKVGNQSMNDCTAWAVGYGAKTYLEARDQGWKPDSPSRVFSPTFLYNQMNGGTDGGSNFYKTILLMQEKGAATLASAPYLPRDFKTQPSTRAWTEAKAYPVLDLVLIKNRKSIRRALQRRQVVVFGAHVNPMFLSGRFENYTRSLFVQDCKLRQPNQAHGKHAMVIVGYDDSKGCFLIQNSWGEGWNKRGYAFVQYELFDEIAIKDDDSVFCNWACTIEDVEEPVEIGSDGLARAKPLDRRTLKASGYSDISRYDQALGKYVYVFTADLRGPKGLLEQVADVTWSWVDENDKERTFSSALGLMRFAILGGTTQNPLKLSGVVKFKDGKTQKISHDIVGPNPKADFRQAEIIFEDSYYGPGAGGKPSFWWEAKLDFPLEQRDDIVKVKWDVGKMNWRDPIQVNDGFNGKPGEEKAIGMCQTPSLITAEIHYIDGGIKTVSLMPKITDEVNENFRIQVNKRQMGNSADGRPLYSFTLTIDRPHRKQFEIEHVVWTLDPIFNNPEIWVNSTFERYPAHGSSDRDFRAIATMHMADGSVRKMETWVVLGPGTAYETSDRLAIVSWNTYFGRETGEPAFGGSIQLVGDREQLERIKEVYIQEETGDDNKEYRVVKNKDQPTWYWSISGSREAIVNARVVFEDGQEKKIRYVHQRRLKPNDVLGFEVVMEPWPKTYLNFKNQDTHKFTIWPLGPQQDTVRVTEVEWFHNPVDRRERTAHKTLRTGFPDGQVLTSVLTKPFDLEARFHYHTGFEELVKLPLSHLTSGDLRPQLSIRAYEKFWGYDEGMPWWLLKLSIARDESEYESEVAKVVYTLHSIDREKAYKPFESTSPQGEFSMRIDRPCTVTADIEFKDGRKRKLETFVTASSVRREHPIHLLKMHNNYQWNISGDQWLLVVDAWESERSKLASVTFTAEEDYLSETKDFSDGVPGVITYSRLSGKPEVMKVEAKKKDGTVTNWEVTMGEPVEPINWSYKVSYWGGGYWQVDINAVGDWWFIKNLGKSFALGGHSKTTLNFEDVGAWPLSRKRAYAKAGEFKIEPGSSNQGALAGLDLKLGMDGKAQSEALQLSVAPSPFKHALATVPEWIMAIVGPEGFMVEIESVDYVYEDSVPRTAHVTHRWGEFFSSFEHRTHGAVAPAIKATVNMKDGKKVYLSFEPK